MERLEASEPTSLILTGPTGIGKTEIAVKLALRRGFELISADSMQVYRGMEIGTAQPTREELKGVPYHCSGIIRPGEIFSAKRFIELSDQARREILARGRQPLYVGGTGMYLRALRWGMFDSTPDLACEEEGEDLRARLNRELEEFGSQELHSRLTKVDPAAAERIAPRDGVRIVRALEVALSTGKTLSSLQTQWRELKPRFPHVLVILTSPRQVLVRRIERRVEAMFDSGWVEEVNRLLADGCSPQMHAFKALGYREIAAHLEGRCSESETREKIKAGTRQFSKRQMTWFRREIGARWVQFDGRDPDEAVGQIEKILEGGGADHLTLPLPKENPSGSGGT
ncbi:tRNA (adenosine(37)-N6)-dimethylallyltransferase MiaA [Candidatus Sumerlaeota bacterium]|nr:tRNA (adenosine(37)-N6)-dimethylallyltransferase MiaA [Candidatus Sumerlaeota bacterium]